MQLGEEGISGVPLGSGVGGTNRHSLSFTLGHRQGFALSVGVDGTASDQGVYVVAIPQSEIQTLDENGGETLSTSVTVGSGIERFGRTGWG